MCGGHTRGRSRRRESCSGATLPAVSTGVVAQCGGGTTTSWQPSVPAPPDGLDLRSRSGPEGKVLLEDDQALRVQSDRALESRTLWVAKLVTSDGRVPIERCSVEFDEKTFIDRDGRSLHLVGRTCRMNGSRRPFALDAAPGRSDFAAGLAHFARDEFGRKSKIDRWSCRSAIGSLVLTGRVESEHDRRNSGR